MNLEDTDKELVRLHDKALEYHTYGTQNYDDWLTLTTKTIDIAEDLIEYLHRPDTRVENFREWMNEYFQFYKDNGSASSVNLVRTIEAKFEEIFKCQK